MGNRQSLTSNKIALKRRESLDVLRRRESGKETESYTLHRSLRLINAYGRLGSIESRVGRERAKETLVSCKRPAGRKGVGRGVETRARERRAAEQARENRKENSTRTTLLLVASGLLAVRLTLSAVGGTGAVVASVCSRLWNRSVFLAPITNRDARKRIQTDNLGIDRHRTRPLLHRIHLGLVRRRVVHRTNLVGILLLRSRIVLRLVKGEKDQLGSGPNTMQKRNPSSHPPPPYPPPYPPPPYPPPPPPPVRWLAMLTRSLRPSIRREKETWTDKSVTKL